MKILISGAGGNVADSIIKILYKKHSIISASSYLYKYKLSKKHYKTPLVKNEKKYLSFIDKIIKKENVDIFFPCIDSEIPIISKNQKKLKCTVFVDKFNKVIKCHDKYLTYFFLKKLKINTPLTKVFDGKNLDKFKSKIILKKRIGNASKGIKYFENIKKINIKKNKSYLIQEYIDGKDYTCGSYQDKKRKIYCVILERKIKNGLTFKCKLVIDKNITKQIIKISKKINLKYVNIQFKLFRNKVYIYELNPRISGTTGFQGYVFNAPENFINEKLGLKVKKLKKLKKLNGIRCQKTKLLKKR